jgi:hypothetical protein
MEALPSKQQRHSGYTLPASSSSFLHIILRGCRFPGGCGRVMCRLAVWFVQHTGCRGTQEAVEECTVSCSCQGVLIADGVEFCQSQQH